MKETSNNTSDEAKGTNGECEEGESYDIESCEEELEVCDDYAKVTEELGLTNCYMLESLMKSKPTSNITASDMKGLQFGMVEEV